MPEYKKKLSLIFSFFNEECIKASISELESILDNIK